MSNNATKSRLSTLQPEIIRLAYEKIDWTYMQGDHMLGPTADHNHYREVGESALRCIYASLLLANVESPKFILDFGCGSGRVTRWFKAVFPESKITACDVREDSLVFLSKTFDILPWLSKSEICDLISPHKYDLIWCGSVATHLAETKTIDLLKKFSEWLNPGGIAIITLHGNRMRDNLINNRIRYMREEQKPKFLEDVVSKGYGYIQFEGKDVGNSSNTVPWIVSKIEELNCKIITISEAAWDKHQDVIAFQKPF